MFHRIKRWLNKRGSSIKNIEAEPVNFSNGNTAQLLRVSSDIEIERIVKTLRLYMDSKCLVYAPGI